MKKCTILLTLLVSLISSIILFSQTIPQTINYQGVLKDAAGVVVTNGDYNITFKLYNTELGGTELWTETKLINVVDGIINTQLGSATLLSLPFDAAYWLGITVSSGSELTPRIKLSSVPYSFMTMNVMDGSITTSKLQDGAVTINKIADNSVNSSKIIDGTIAASDIGDNQVIKKINGIRDSVNIIAGSNVTITPSGNTITIDASGGSSGTITGVTAGSGLTGGGTSGNVTLSVADNGITTVMLQDNSVNSSKIIDGTVVTADLSNNSVTSDKIADGTVTSTDILNGTITATDIATTQVVKSLNTLKDDVTLVAGSNITITPSGQNLTIASTSGGTIGGSGTVNYVPIFTGSTTLGNSPISYTAPITKVSTVFQIENNVNDLTRLIIKNTNTGQFSEEGITFENEEGQMSGVYLFDNDNTIYPSQMNIFNNRSGGSINFSTDGVERVKINNNGNVGIGTKTPISKLTIYKDDLSYLQFHNSTTGTTANDGCIIGTGNIGSPVWIWNGEDSDMHFGTNNHQRMTIKNNGNVEILNNLGIGGISPSYPLHVSTNRSRAGNFTSDSLSGLTNIVRSEYTGATGTSDVRAFYGYSSPAGGFGIGGEFRGGYMGVYGYNDGGNYAGASYGVYGHSQGTAGYRYGVYGYAGGGNNNYAVYGYAGGGTTSWAGYFEGNVRVIGTLTKTAGSFKIDHPLDPENKYLYHSFVESPDMMNIYNGNIVTDASGYATVTLPDWFEALNKEFRYQLTVIGDFAQAIISKEIQNNQFEIRTDKPNIKISWQVTGIRHDAYAEKNRIPVEELKRTEEIGKYIYPEGFGLSKESSIDFQQRDERMKEIENSKAPNTNSSNNQEKQLRDEKPINPYGISE